MAYQAWSVVFGEQPTAAKWNILGTNDASFNDGTGIADNAILNRHIDTNAIRYSKVDQSNWANGAGLYTLQIGTFSTTSASIVDIGSTSFAQTLTVNGGKLFIFAFLSCSVSTNTAQIYINIDGTNYAITQVSNTSAQYVPMGRVVTGVTSGSKTFKLTVSIPGGATFTSTQFASRGICVVEI